MSDPAAAGDPPDDFVRVGRLDEFPERRGRAVRVAGEAVAVFRVGGRVFALRDACPHMGASLADGRIDRGCVECHWHHWRFDLESGQAEERSWARAARYEVRVLGGEVWLKPPAPAAGPPDAAPADDEDWIFWDASRYFKDKRASEGAADGEEGADQADREPGGED